MPLLKIIALIILIAAGSAIGCAIYDTIELWKDK